MRCLYSRCFGLWALLALAACQPDAPTRSSYAIMFHGEDDRGQALEGVELALGSAEIGRTNEHGTLQAQVVASHGQRYSVEAKCPEGHELAQVPTDLAFRDTRALVGKPSPVSVRIVCSRHLRVAAILVHAAGMEGLPISIDGVVEGHTGPGGIEHLSINGEPGTNVDVAIDTSSMPNLRPSNPSRVLRIGADDSLLIFEQEFSMEKPVRKQRKRMKKAQVTPIKKRPMRID